MSYRIHITLRYFECPKISPQKLHRRDYFVPHPAGGGVSRGKNQKTKRNGKTDRGANTKQNYEVMSRVDKQIDVEARCLSPCCMFPCLASCCHQHHHHHHLIIINFTLRTLNRLFQSFHSISSAQYQPFFDPIPFQMVVTPQLKVQKTLLSQDVVLQMLDRQLC